MLKPASYSSAIKASNRMFNKLAGMQNLQKLVLISALLLGAPASMAAEDEVTAEQVVGAMENVFGVTPGERRNHTKGVCATGAFVGDADARSYSRSGMFSGKSIPVVARFSLGGGNPGASDASRGVRGMALEFRLADGGLQHMTMLNTPMFGAAQVRTFLDMMIAMKPDPATGKPSPEAIKAFRATHPDNQAQANFLADHNPPPSYANSAYFGIHTFKFINRANKTTLVRWRFVPQDGEKQLSNEDAASMPHDFLEQALIERTKRGPVRWNMLITLGQPGDAENNPTLAWPAGRKEVKIGTLTISSATPQKNAECEQINFDPLVMSDGIEPTNDPILLFRSQAYAYSFAKRLGGM